MRLRPIALIAGFSVAALTPALAHTDAASADDIARSFVPVIETFISHLDAETEEFAVRINRCVGRQGELSDTMFYVWIGWRGVASSDNAAEILTGIHSEWSAHGWDITRNREISNGGVNIAATDLETGYAYSLDSGFDAGPNAYIVGFFNTRCHESPSSPAPFGPWSS